MPNLSHYSYDYFGGAHTRIYIGQAWVDDIVTLNFNAVQQKSPVYGYGSQEFDMIADGTFIVQGSFSVAFKENGYLKLILNQYSRRLKNESYTDLLKRLRNKSRQSAMEESGGSTITSIDGRNNPVYGYKKDGKVHTYLGNLRIEDLLQENFEDLAEVLEDSIWGPQVHLYQAPRIDQLSIGAGGEGFDIIVTYGDVDFGGAEHTVKAINNIHLTGHSQIIQPTGEPIGEVYTFFARDMDKYLGDFREKIETREDYAKKQLAKKQKEGEQDATTSRGSTKISTTEDEMTKALISQASLDPHHETGNYEVEPLTGSMRAAGTRPASFRAGSVADFVVFINNMTASEQRKYVGPHLPKTRARTLVTSYYKWLKDSGRAHGRQLRTIVTPPVDQYFKGYGNVDQAGGSDKWGKPVT